MAIDMRGERLTKRPGPLRALGRTLVRLCAALFLLQVVLAIPPFHGIVEAWLEVPDTGNVVAPKYIVVLGGGGIPSDTGLMRTYFGAAHSIAHPEATVIVALPADESPEISSVGRMRDELVMRGVPPSSILMETRGRNTHEQAVEIREMLGAGALTATVHIVTDRTHLRRSVLAFRKVGFEQVSGIGTYSTGAEADIGPGAFLRYTLWSNLQLQVRILRELIAAVLYKSRGWI